MAEGTVCAKCGGQVGASERFELVREREQQPAGMVTGAWTPSGVISLRVLVAWGFVSRCCRGRAR